MHKRFEKPSLQELLTVPPPILNFQSDSRNALIVQSSTTIGKNDYIVRVAAYEIKFMSTGASGIILDGMFDYDHNNPRLQYTIYADRFKLIAHLMHALSTFITLSNKKLITPIDAVSFGATKSYNGFHLMNCNLFERMYEMMVEYYRETAHPMAIHSYDINMPNQKGIDYVGKMHVVANVLSPAMVNDIKTNNLDLKIK